jgi:hypothetical protein
VSANSQQLLDGWLTEQMIKIGLVPEQASHPS